MTGRRQCLVQAGSCHNIVNQPNSAARFRAVNALGQEFVCRIKGPSARFGERLGSECCSSSSSSHAVSIGDSTTGFEQPMHAISSFSLILQPKPLPCPNRVFFPRQEGQVDQAAEPTDTRAADDGPLYLASLFLLQHSRSAYIKRYHGPTSCIMPLGHRLGDGSTASASRHPRQEVTGAQEDISGDPAHRSFEQGTEEYYTASCRQRCCETRSPLSDGQMTLTTGQKVSMSQIVTLK